jgi:hypothetical protein
MGIQQTLSPACPLFSKAEVPMQNLRKAQGAVVAFITALGLAVVIFVTAPRELASAAQPSNDQTTAEQSDDVSATQPAVLGEGPAEDSDEGSTTRPSEPESPTTQPAATQPAS